MFERQLNIYYRGPKDREQFVASLADDIEIEQEHLMPTFSRGYGGNRNLILASFPHERVISLDDDMIPSSLRQRDPYHPEYLRFVREWSCTDPEDIFLEHGEEMTTEETEEMRYDFIKEILAPLGKRISEVAFPHVQKAESFDQDSDTTVKTASPASFNPDATISSVAVRISNHPDYKETHLNLERAAVYPQMEPAVLKEAASFAPACYAADHQITASYPFLPTSLRCEEFLHREFLEETGQGYFALIARDVVHRRGKREPLTKKEIVYGELTALVFVGLIAYTGRELKYDCMKVGSCLVNVTFSIIEEFLESAIKQMRESGVSVRLSQKERYRIKKEILVETIYTAQALLPWKFIIERQRSTYPQQRIA